MAVPKGTRVTIDGRSATVVGHWGQGKHTVYRLSDGRTVYDLPELEGSGDAVVEEPSDPVAEEIIATPEEFRKTVERLRDETTHDDTPRRGRDWDLSMRDDQVD
jgi:hypothetical protein